MITWLDMQSPPQIHSKGVFIPPVKKKGTVFGQQRDNRVLMVDDLEVREVNFFS